MNTAVTIYIIDQDQQPTRSSQVRLSVWTSRSQKL